MLVHIKDLVKGAKKNKYAIGAFNVHGLESVLGIARAAAEAKSPAIIEVSEGAIAYMGLEVTINLVRTIADTVAASVPIALHLDHGKNLEIVNKCIVSGFSSIHIDASAFPFEENIEISKKVVSFAHSRGVWAQGEIGSIMGGHGDVGGEIHGIPIADPDEVVEFVRRTKVDTIAAAIGTAHGTFTNEDINFKILKKIKDNIKKPFVLHGGSGVPTRKIKRAIKEGVNIINIGTNIKVAFSETLIETCKKNKKEMDPRNLLKPSIQAIEDAAIKQMKIMGSADQIKTK